MILNWHLACYYAIYSPCFSVVFCSTSAFFESTSFDSALSCPSAAISLAVAVCSVIGGRPVGESLDDCNTLECDSLAYFDVIVRRRFQTVSCLDAVQLLLLSAPGQRCYVQNILNIELRLGQRRCYYSVCNSSSTKQSQTDARRVRSRFHRARSINQSTPSRALPAALYGTPLVTK